MWACSRGEKTRSLARRAALERAGNLLSVLCVCVLVAHSSQLASLGRTRRLRAAAALLRRARTRIRLGLSAVRSMARS